MAALASTPLLAQSSPRVVVVGAGAFGGWTALHLRRLGANVTLIDSWGPGNARSSSGGETRVIRAVYGPDRVYVEMVKRSYELWESIASSAGEPLYVETGALWMHRDDDGYLRSSLPILKDLGFPVDAFTPEEAKRRWPQIDFAGVKSIWMERRAGALSARRACMVVRDAFVKAGGTYRTAHVDLAQLSGAPASSPASRRDSAAVPLKTLRLSDGATLEADAFVLACGPWLGQVLGGAIQPTRQEVYFFGAPRGSDRYMPPRLPVWIDFGERIYYGIPDTHGRGFKLADDTRGAPFDPTSGDRTPGAEGIARARAFLAERFPELASAPLLESRVCQYENSPDGHLVVDRHPAAGNVWVAGGGSGHGFKFSPAVGEMTAQAIVNGGEIPPMFRLDRLGGAKERATQFERKTKA